MNFGLQDIELHDLPTMTCLFKGLKNSFSLKNLTGIKIVRCEKLEIVFSTSIIMCLPQLLHMRVEECKELKHIIEDDLETKTVCFPKLKRLVVLKCNQLKNIFPISICKELHELEILMIREADKLEEIFVCEEGDEKVNIPNLKFVAFDNLPSLCQTQRIHFHAVPNRFVTNCQELSLTNAITEDIGNIKNYCFYISGTNFVQYFYILAVNNCISYIIIYSNKNILRSRFMDFFSFKINLYILTFFLPRSRMKVSTFLSRSNKLYHLVKGYNRSLKFI